MIKCCKFYLMLFNSVFFICGTQYKKIILLHYYSGFKQGFLYDKVDKVYRVELKDGKFSSGSDDKIEDCLDSNNLEVIEKGESNGKQLAVWIVVKNSDIEEINCDTYGKYDVILTIKDYTVRKKFSEFIKEIKNKGSHIYTDGCVVFTGGKGERHELLCYKPIGCDENGNLISYDVCISPVVGMALMPPDITKIIAKYEQTNNVTVNKKVIHKAESADFTKVFKEGFFDDEVLDNSSPSGSSGSGSGSGSGAGASSNPKKKKKCCCC